MMPMIYQESDKNWASNTWEGEQKGRIAPTGNTVDTYSGRQAVTNVRATRHTIDHPGSCTTPMLVHESASAVRRGASPSTSQDQGLL